VRITSSNSFPPEQVNADPIARECPISSALGRGVSSPEEIGVTREVVFMASGLSGQTLGADDPGLDADFGAYEWPQPTVGQRHELAPAVTKHLRRQDSVSPANERLLFSSTPT